MWPKIKTAVKCRSNVNRKYRFVQFTLSFSLSKALYKCEYTLFSEKWEDQKTILSRVAIHHWYKTQVQWHQTIKRTDPKILDKRHEKKRKTTIVQLSFYFIALPNIAACKPSSMSLILRSVCCFIVELENTPKNMFELFVGVWSACVCVVKCIDICLFVLAGVRAVGEVCGETRWHHGCSHQRQKSCSHWPAASSLNCGTTVEWCLKRILKTI